MMHNALMHCLHLSLSLATVVVLDQLFIICLFLSQSSFSKFRTLYIHEIVDHHYINILLIISSRYFLESYIHPNMIAQSIYIYFPYISGLLLLQVVKTNWKMANHDGSLTKNQHVVEQFWTRNNYILYVPGTMRIHALMPWWRNNLLKWQT